MMIEVPAEVLEKVLIGIIASITLYILGFVSREVVTYYRIQRPFAKVWGLEKKGNLYLVTGNIYLKGDKEKTYMRPGDIRALAELLGCMSVERNKLKLKHILSKDFPSGLLDENLAVIGGPKFNNVTALMLEKIGKFSFDTSTLILKDNISSKEYAPTRKNGKVVQDFALILKVKNPYCLEKNLVLIAGCTTNGVYAGARSLSSINDQGRKNLRRLSEMMGGNKYFAVILRTDVIDDIIYDFQIEQFYSEHCLELI